VLQGNWPGSGWKTGDLEIALLPENPEYFELAGLCYTASGKRLLGLRDRMILRVFVDLAPAGPRTWISLFSGAGLRLTTMRVNQFT
jgi:hypothetical protein